MYKYRLTITKLSTRIKFAAAFGLALLLFGLTGAFSWLSMVNLGDDAQMVAHTHEVLENLERIISQLKDAETGQRGFVITGETHYLEPYSAGLLGIELAVANARKLTSDNPSQQRRLDVIGPLIQRKLDELDQTIYLRRNVGFQSALEVIVTDAGVRTMDELRAVIAEMERDERQLLEQRDEATAATSKKQSSPSLSGPSCPLSSSG